MSDEETEVADARKWASANRNNCARIVEVRWLSALLRALDAAEARAAELERELAAVHENKRCDIDELDVRVERDALRARLTLAERVVEALREGWPGAIEAWCLVDPPCGTCRACSLAKSLAAYDAHAKGGGT